MEKYVNGIAFLEKWCYYSFSLKKYSYVLNNTNESVLYEIYYNLKKGDKDRRNKI